MALLVEQNKYKILTTKFQCSFSSLQFCDIAKLTITHKKTQPNLGYRPDMNF